MLSWTVLYLRIFALVYSTCPLVHVNNDVFNLDDIIMVNVYEKACLLCCTRGKHHRRATRVTNWAHHLYDWYYRTIFLILLVLRIAFFLFKSDRIWMHHYQNVKFQKYIRNLKRVTVPKILILNIDGIGLSNTISSIVALQSSLIASKHAGNAAPTQPAAQTQRRSRKHDPHNVRPLTLALFTIFLYWFQGITSLWALLCEMLMRFARNIIFVHIVFRRKVINVWMSSKSIYELKAGLASQWKIWH